MKAVDRFALHRKLWERTDHFGKTEILQKQVAEELGITIQTMSHIMKEFVEEGRIRKISAKRRNVGVYLVRDPSLFPHVFKGVKGNYGTRTCRECGDLETVGNHTLNIL